MHLSSHRAGFVNIMGKPNAGKSTLMNTLLGYSLSIATYKPQTTRHTILGIDNGKDHQIIYVDVPGYMKPHYELQKIMLRQVKRALIESDIIVWLVNSREKEIDDFLLDNRKMQTCPFLLVVNKVDLLDQAERAELSSFWQKNLNPTSTIFISALYQTNLDQLKAAILKYLPLHPAYYDKREITTRTERFLVAQIIRKAIILSYHQEIPYSTEVIVDSFKEKEDILCIEATIYVERMSQKSIVIGKKGAALKKIGIQARKEIESIFKKKVFLSQYVKVSKDWRNQTKQLTAWGYQ
ncbi:MAG: GTPase Era [Bacteroidota bacterium]